MAQPTPVVLGDGVPVMGLAGSAGEAAYYVITVPAGASQLGVAMSGGTGDADLYVRAGEPPTTTEYDCRPFLFGDLDSYSKCNKPPDRTPQRS